MRGFFSCDCFADNLLSLSRLPISMQHNRSGRNTRHNGNGCYRSYFVENSNDTVYDDQRNAHTKEATPSRATNPLYRSTSGDGDDGLLELHELQPSQINYRSNYGDNLRAMNRNTLPKPCIQSAGCDDQCRIWKRLFCSRSLRNALHSEWGVVSTLSEWIGRNTLRFQDLYDV